MIHPFIIVIMRPVWNVAPIAGVKYQYCINTL